VDWIVDRKSLCPGLGAIPKGPIDNHIERTYHLAPYLGAQELPVDHGLSLGLAAEAIYTESSFHLDTDQELTLLSRMAKTGELFGFERTASISILSAEHIAATARAFGQQDEITVLKICR
jgi:phosphoserine phosphatase RsbU/P